MSDTTDTLTGAERRIAERDARRDQMLDELLREKAARDAGLDVANPMVRMLLDTYQGEPEGLAAKAKEYGIVSQAEQNQQQQADAATAGLGRTTSAASTAGGGSPQAAADAAKNQQLTEKAAELMEKAKKRQGDREEVFEFAKLAGVPMVGDDQ